MKQALVVDDEPSSRILVAAILTRLSWTVRTAGDARDAIRISRAYPAFELLVTDLEMPGLRGDDLARLILGERPRIRVLIVSGAADTITAWDSRVDVLSKPFEIDSFERAVGPCVHTQAVLGSLHAD